MQYCIGSSHWPGTSKLIEECGETIQILGKLLGRGGTEAPWADKDRGSLTPRLIEELGDLSAAIHFFTEANGLDQEALKKRADNKFATYSKWHKDD